MPSAWYTEEKEVRPLYKRLLSTALAVGFLLCSARAADTELFLTADGEAASDAALSALADTRSISHISLFSSNNETGFLSFDGTNFQFQPCGETAIYSYPVLFSTTTPDALGRPVTDWFLSSTDLSEQFLASPYAEWDARRVCSVSKWTNCGTVYLTEQNCLRLSSENLQFFIVLKAQDNRALSLQFEHTLGDTAILVYCGGEYILSECGTVPLRSTHWTQLAPLPRDGGRTLSLVLTNDQNTRQRELLHYTATPPYLHTLFPDVSIP